MQLKKLKNISGYYVYQDVIISGKKLIAMVDTGCTSIIVDKDMVAAINQKVVDVVGVNAESKATTSMCSVQINKIKKRREVVFMDFNFINQVCKDSGVAKYDAIIGIREIKDFNLQKKLYDSLKD